MEENRPPALFLSTKVLDIMTVLEPDQIGKIIVNAYDAFQENEVTYELDRISSAIFNVILQDIEYNDERYKKRCEKNRQNIAKRWQNQKQNPSIQSNTNVYDGIQSNTTEYNRIQSNTNINKDNIIQDKVNKDKVNKDKVNKDKVNKDNKEEEYKEEANAPVETSSSTKHPEEIKQILDYLNEKTGKKYKATSDKNRKHINARLNEGFSVEDFKKVIDIKSAEWLHNNDMEKYLRPETLFGNKFEDYLNQNTQVNNNGSFDSDEAFGVVVGW